MASGSKMNRQVRIYIDICNTECHGPDELTRRFEMSLRTLKRDIKDFFDSGVMKLNYDKKRNNYTISEEVPEFNESVIGRRREHLIKLRRLITLIDKLPITDIEALEHYESELNDYEYFKGEGREEYIEDYGPIRLLKPPVRPEFDDIAAIYKSLFPDVSKKTRERDFKELCAAGYPVYYNRKLRIYVCKGAVNYD